MSDAAPALELADVHAWYGESHVLHGMNFAVHRGEVVTLLGRNGAGRTTTLKAILGMVGRRAGSVRIDGKETIALTTYRIARMGLGYCPEERGIYASLSVEENLMLPPAGAGGGLGIDEVYRMFPNLYERRRTSQGSRLSGGEQQMLAIARILRTAARVLLLDEITEGLAPVIVQALGGVIRRLKERGYTVVLVEQNFRFAAPLADRHYVIEHGRVMDSFSAAELGAKTAMLNEYLGV